MDRLQKYILKNLSSLFLSIFLPLFTIASVIFLIKLATYTAVIQLSIWEMTKLYIFVLPEIFFYTLPVTFFIASAISLFRLSNDNEIIVLFALGITPNFILKTLLKPALLLSFLMAFDFFILFPHATVLSSNFISYKRSEAKFNLSASEFGHKFGDWLLYIGKKNDNKTYGDVLLFNKNKKEEVLISAKEAKVINEGGVLKLKLKDGEGYSYSQKSFSQINFETMLINDTLTTDLTTYRTPLEYWKSNDRAKSKRHMMITDVLLSLFPTISLFLVATIGVVNTRHQKSRIYLYLFLGILVYFSATLIIQGYIAYYTIPLVAVLWTVLTYMLYKKVILSRF